MLIIVGNRLVKISWSLLVSLFQQSEFTVAFMSIKESVIETID